MQALQNTKLGGLFGDSIGMGINQLAQNKLANLMQQHDKVYERAQYAKGLAPLLGQDTANFLSNLPDQQRGQALQSIGSLMQLNSSPEPQSQDSGISLLGGEQQQPQGKKIKDVLGSLAHATENTNESMPDQKKIDFKLQKQKSPEKGPEVEIPEEDTVSSRRIKKDIEKKELERNKINLKETKKYVDTLKSQEKAANESDLRLKRMETLINGGNLPNANLWSFLSKIEDLGPLATGGAGAIIGSVAGPGVGTAVGAGIGGIIGALSAPLAGAAKSFIKSGSPDIEEFEKLSFDFVKNAKQFFGSRLTDADLKVFMQTLPTLMQTDGGKKRVINNLRALNELSLIEAKAARSIIAANGGIPPLDIEQQVQDKISDKIDKVSKKFIG